MDMSSASAPPKSAGQLTLEQFAQQQQVQAMSTLHLQLVSYLTSKPPVTAWPVEVRRHMHEQLLKCIQLFGPQSEEEDALYHE